MICRHCPAKISFVKINKGVKRALKVRLEFILADMIRNYTFWDENARRHLKATRQAQVERKMKQQIQALKIVIWMLTPSNERMEDFPGFWKN